MPRSLLAARLGLAQDDCETASAKAEALRNAPGHRHLVAVAGNSKAVAVNPHGAAAVVHLKHTAAQSSIRSRDTSRDGYILACVFAGVLFKVGNFCGSRTPGEQ